jgi:hypothetical protein
MMTPYDDEDPEAAMPLVKPPPSEVSTSKWNEYANTVRDSGCASYALSKLILSQFTAQVPLLYCNRMSTPTLAKVQTRVRDNIHLFQVFYLFSFLSLVMLHLMGMVLGLGALACMSFYSIIVFNDTQMWLTIAAPFWCIYVTGILFFPPFLGVGLYFPVVAAHAVWCEAPKTGWEHDSVYNGKLTRNSRGNVVF